MFRNHGITCVVRSKRTQFANANLSEKWGARVGTYNPAWKEARSRKMQQTKTKPKESERPALLYFEGLSAPGG